MRYWFFQASTPILTNIHRKLTLCVNIRSIMDEYFNLWKFERILNKANANISMYLSIFMP